MTIDNIVALVLGGFIGFGIVQGMLWLVMKARSQSRSNSTGITRTPNGSIHIQAGDGEDLFITCTIRAGDGVGTKRKGGHHGPSESDRK